MRNLFAVLILILCVFMVSAVAGLSDEIGGNTLDEFVFNPSDMFVFSDANNTITFENNLQIKLTTNYNFDTGLEYVGMDANLLDYTQSVLARNFEKTSGVKQIGWTKEVPTTRHTKSGTVVSTHKLYI